MKLIRIQPSEFVDQIRDGREMTKQPYPYFVTDDGRVTRQDFWKGDPSRVVGFTGDLAAQRIDLWWDDAAKDPERAIGMYLVTCDRAGTWSTHTTAIASADVVETAGDASRPG